jgi:hypothetical protein
VLKAEIEMEDTYKKEKNNFKNGLVTGRSEVKARVGEKHEELLQNLILIV